MAQLKNTKINGTTEHLDGHIYLTGADAGSSTGNTTQLVFGTSVANHVVLSSNEDALVINPDVGSTTNQIVLYLNQPSKFPSGIEVGGKSLLDRTYPVGSVYISYNTTSPSELFGGTWTQITGVFPRFDNNINGGGADTHTLSATEMPKHTHKFTGSSSTTVSAGAHTHNLKLRKTDWSGSGSSRVVVDASSGYTALDNKATTSAGAHTHTVTAAGSNANTGGGGAHNNMPKYQNMYAWRRTA